MTLLVAIIIGALVGWLASRLLGRNEGLVMSIIIGIVGSFLGSLLSLLFVGSDQSYLGFSWMGVFWSLVGAVIFVAILNFFSGRSRTAAPRGM